MKEELERNWSEVLERWKESAWRKASIRWSYRLTPPFPTHWPLRPGVLARLVSYAYADGLDYSGKLADGVRVAAPWAQVEAPLDGSGPPHIRLLSTVLMEVGIQGVQTVRRGENPSDLASDRDTLAKAYRLMWLAGGEQPAAARQLRTYFAAWTRTHGVIAGAIRPFHESFFNWLMK